MNQARILLLFAIITLIGLFFVFDLHQFFTLEVLKNQQTAITAQYDAYPFLTSVLYALIYIVVTGLSLPGATLLTLAGGAIFGFLWGTIIVSFASTLGATIAFWAARYLFRDTVEKRFGDRLQVIDKGIEREGAFYLFTLRMVPLFPFFIINLVMGLTSMKTWTFYWVSQVGMLAGTMVYVNAGTQLGKVEALSDILSPVILGSFILLGLFPLIAKKGVAAIKAGKILQNWRQSESFDTCFSKFEGLVANVNQGADKAKKYIAEVWKQVHGPGMLLKVLERYRTWKSR